MSYAGRMGSTLAFSVKLPVTAAPDVKLNGKEGQQHEQSFRMVCSPFAFLGLNTKVISARVSLIHLAWISIIDVEKILVGDKLLLSHYRSFNKFLWHDEVSRHGDINFEPSLVILFDPVAVLLNLTLRYNLNSPPAIMRLLGQWVLKRNSSKICATGKPASHNRSVWIEHIDIHRVRECL